jgi:hypothetical protein
MNTLFDYGEYNTDGSILKSNMPAVNSAEAYDMACAEVEFSADRLEKAVAVVMVAETLVSLDPTSETRSFLDRVKSRAKIAERYYGNAIVNRYTAEETLLEERASAAALAAEDLDAELAAELAAAELAAEELDAELAEELAAAELAAEELAAEELASDAKFAAELAAEFAAELAYAENEPVTVFRSYASIVAESNRGVYV